jgi:uncharacterized protein (DUF2141 family)
MKILTFLLLCVFWANSARADELTINITGIRFSSGHLLIGVFDSLSKMEISKHRDGDKHAVVYQAVEIKKHTPAVSLTFKNLPPGVYAVGVIHDVNNNRQMDVKGLIQKPVEPFGMSRNPPISIRFPKWESVSFKVAGEATIDIPLRYL